MKRRFVVLLNGGTPQQNKAFIEFAKESGLGYWHWLNNSWLLTTFNHEITSSEIRDKLMALYPNVHNMVLELNEDGTDTWRGFGPSGEEKNMFTWMKQNWKKNN